MDASSYQERQHLLETTVKSMRAAPSLNVAIETARRTARTLMACDGFTFVRRIGEQTDYLAEDAIETLWAGLQFDIDKCLAGRAMLREQTVVVPDITHVENIPLNAYLATFVRRLVAVPIGSPHPTHAICFYWRESGSIDPDDVVLGEGLAKAIGEALDRFGEA